MLKPGEDAAQRLVHWLNIKEAWYLREGEKNLVHGAAATDATKIIEAWRQSGQAEWRAVENAQRAIGEVVRALQEKRTAEARRLMESNFRQVPITWDVLKDRWGHGVVTPVVESATPLGYGICLLGAVTQLHLTRRIRECKRCRTWFFAKPAKKIFCSPTCQEEFWAEKRRGRKEHDDRG
jgi:hypothetical protein